MKKASILSFFLVIIATAIFYFWPYSGHMTSGNETIEPKVIVIPDREVVVMIEPDMTFSIATEQAGLDFSVMTALYETAEDVYDLASVRVGRGISYIFDKDTDEFKKLIYQIDSEDELIIVKDEEGNWLAERVVIPYEIKLKTVSGTIDSSLYVSALDLGIDERAIIALADVFAWTIDFSWGIRTGDTYKFIYEERYRDGQYMMPGKVIAARFVNDGNMIEGFYFFEGEDEDGKLVEGYYDTEGASLQKIFLKNPVDFRYISSGFTTGRRYVEAFNVSTGHRAIDYAAKSGTPIRAVGDGTVRSAGWSSQGYGYLVSIRHNSVFNTNYAHQSRLAVSSGQRVTQGQIIGYVGSTGFSTGPHLHFELVKNGTKINPLTVDLPSDKSIAEENMPAYLAEVVRWQEKLN